MKVFIDIIFRTSKSAAKTIKNSIVSILSGLKRFVFSVNGLFSAFATGLIVKTVDEFQRLNVALRNLEGSGKVAERVFSELQQLARKTPYSFQEVIRTYTTLRGLFEKRVAYSLTEDIMKLGAAFGLTNEQIQRLNLAFSQIFAKGKLQAEELNQIMEASPIIANKLAEALGMTSAQFRQLAFDGKVSADTIKEAIQKLSAQLGDLEEQPRTLGQVFSNLFDSINTGLYRIGENLGVWDLMENAIDGVSKTLEGLSSTIADVLSGLKSIGEESSKIEVSKERLEAYELWKDIYKIGTGKEGVTALFKILPKRLEKLNSALEDAEQKLTNFRNTAVAIRRDFDNIISEEALKNPRLLKQALEQLKIEIEKKTIKIEEKFKDEWLENIDNHLRKLNSLEKEYNNAVQFIQKYHSIREKFAQNEHLTISLTSKILKEVNDLVDAYLKTEEDIASKNQETNIAQNKQKKNLSELIKLAEQYASEIEHKNTLFAKGAIDYDTYESLLADIENRYKKGLSPSEFQFVRETAGALLVEPLEVQQAPIPEFPRRERLLEIDIGDYIKIPKLDANQLRRELAVEQALRTLGDVLKTEGYTIGKEFALALKQGTVPDFSNLFQVILPQLVAQGIATLVPALAPFTGLIQGFLAGLLSSFDTAVSVNQTVQQNINVVINIGEAVINDKEYWERWLERVFVPSLERTVGKEESRG